MVIDKETRGSTVAFLAQINSAYLLTKRVNMIFIVLTILLIFLLSLSENICY